MKYFSNIDLNKNELQNARIQNLGTAPASAVKGQIYFNNVDNLFYGFDGASWINLGKVLNGNEIVTLINGSSSKLEDKNLSTAVNDAISKRHSHGNSSILNAMEQAFTTALKNKLDGIETGANNYTHPGSGSNPHGTTKGDVGLGNVENKSSVTIRGELTKENVSSALGFSPKKILEGIEASKPVATGSMIIYISTDTKKIWLDYLSNTWLQIGGQDTISWGNVTGKPSTFTPPIASNSALGGIKLGSNLSIDADGTLNANDNPSSYIIKQEKFISTEGQSVFTLSKGKYKQGLGTLAVFLNGAKVANTMVDETSQTSFTLKTGLSAGDHLLAEYVELVNINPYPIHGSEHLPGGVDPIPLVTTSKDGLMSKESLSKLNGVASGANNYTHPSTHAASIIVQDTNNRFVSDGEKSTWNGKAAGNHNHSLASLSEKSYNSLSDKPALGSAASKDVGGSSGQVPLIGSNGKLDPTIMPALAISDTFVVNSESAMLGLDAEIGDICVRTDLSKSFILKQSPASTLSNWQELLTPADKVSSVNGMTGAVTINKSHVGLSNVDNIQQATKAEFNSHNGDAVKHITAAERNTWNDRTKKYVTNIGNGTLTTIPITHNLGTMDLSVSIRETSSPYNIVMADVQLVDNNSLNLLFATAPSSNQYSIAVIG